jgi:RNA-binding protein NOB1
MSSTLQLTPSDPPPKQITKLVVDTAAFIKKIRLEKLADEFYTVPEVLSEVRDSEARQFFETLLIQFKTREPSTDAIRHVIEFSKKTGDYPSLSKVDIKVLALAYMLEVEAHGSEHLRSSPPPLQGRGDNRKINKNIFSPPPSKKQTVGQTPIEPPSPSSTVSPNNHVAPICNNNNNENSNKGDNGDQQNESPNDEREIKSNASTNLCTKDENVNENTLNLTTSPIISVATITTTTAATVSSSSSPETDKEDQQSRSMDSKFSLDVKVQTDRGVVENPKSLSVTAERTLEDTVTELQEHNETTTALCLSVNKGTSPEVKHPVSTSQQSHCQSPKNNTKTKFPHTKKIGIGHFDKEKDNDIGWITPDNVDEYTAYLQGTLHTESDETPKYKVNGHIKVFCMTSDFAMQNVLLQMGLNLISPDGKTIRRVQQWVLRCFACFKICKDVTRLFCPMCGNHTLRRVSYSVSKDGNVIYNMPRRPISRRGMRYPIPKPKGGRHNKDLILSEAQLPRGYYKRQQNKNLLSIDEPADSIGPRKNPLPVVVVGYGRRNPNEPKKKYGKKNKSRRQGY